jgi:hypothetical protein
MMFSVELISTSCVRLLADSNAVYEDINGIAFSVERVWSCPTYLLIDSNTADLEEPKRTSLVIVTRTSAQYDDMGMSLIGCSVNHVRSAEPN